MFDVCLLLEGEKEKEQAQSLLDGSSVMGHVSDNEVLKNVGESIAA